MSQKKAKQQRIENRQHTLFWGSSYDRGLDILLFMWPSIIEKFPDAKLNICYGWDLFDALRGGNPERLKWQENVKKMMQQPGIVHWGRVGKEKLQEIRKECGIWAYSSYFPEINCITALECQNDGVVPVTMDDFALSETVGSGIKVKGDIHDLEVQEEFKNQLLNLMGDTQKWQEESKKAKEFAKSYTWNNIAPKWVDYFKEPVKNPLVSVITVTIRPGFWNVMAKNLSKQTYKNFEWVIVDDYKEDRSETAKKYAEKYGITIKYVRGDKVMGNYDRRHGLARANNMGWKESNGDLLVYLQDFIFMPVNGLEMMVNVNRHHPNALIAPVDQYWYAKDPNRDNLEDWWDGDTDIVGKFSWRNVRVQFMGVRPTDNPYDFEMNYAGIPRHILDDLNGWWEFFDDGLGFDNTEFASRALQKGYEIIIDDRNEAVCINLWPFIAGQPENIVDRDRHLAPPYYLYLIERMKQGLSPVRDEKLDHSLKFEFEVPKEIPNEKCSEWIKAHTEEIVKGWLEK